MRIIFVYAGSLDEASEQSPYTITKNLYRFFKNKGLDILYYNWTDGNDVDIQPDDIIIGHPAYDVNSVIQKMFRNNKPCRAKCLIHPLHHGRPDDNWPFNELAIQADTIFSIMGKYWYDTLEQSKFAHWKPKIIRLDMAVDGITYPYIKRTFNGIGNRRLVYIGSSIPNKNLGYLTHLMRMLPNVQLFWYGGCSEHPLSKLPNVKVTGWVDIPQHANEICRECDIIVSTSDSDANPTTICQAMAWGLIPACTRESGYYNDPMFTELYLNDDKKSINNLNDLLNTPSEILQERSRNTRQVIEKEYNWDVFCNTVWNGLSKYMI